MGKTAAHSILNAESLGDKRSGGSKNLRITHIMVYKGHLYKGHINISQKNKGQLICLPEKIRDNFMLWM